MGQHTWLAGRDLRWASGPRTGQAGTTTTARSATPSSRRRGPHVDFTAGYVTADDNYTWICQPCFEDFTAQFEWNVVSAPTDS